MISRIKEWLSEFRPHLVTDGELWAVRRRTLIGFVYSNKYRVGFSWWDSEARACFGEKIDAERCLKELLFFKNLRKVDPKNPVRLVEGGEK